MVNQRLTSSPQYTPSPMIDLQVVALCVVVALAVSVFFRQRRRSLPPGPRGVPVLGNVFDVPKEFEWLAYDRWSREYGMSRVPSNFFRISVVDVVTTCRLRHHLSQPRWYPRCRCQFGPSCA